MGLERRATCSFLFLGSLTVIGSVKKSFEKGKVGGGRLLQQTG